MTMREPQDVFESSPDLWLERHVVLQDDSKHYIESLGYFEYSLTNYKPIIDDKTGEYISPQTYPGCNFFFIILNDDAVEKLEIDKLNMEPNSLVQVTDVKYEDILNCLFVVVGDDDEDHNYDDEDYDDDREDDYYEDEE